MPPPSPRELRAAWLAKYAREPAPWRGPARPAPPLAAALAALPPSARALEVGAGGGKTLAALRRVAPGTVALDWVPPRAPDARFALGDAAALPFRSGAFDLVVLNHVLGHLPRASREAAAREAWRVARPGGRVAAEVFARGDLRDGAGTATDEAGTYRREGILTRYFDAAELASLFPAPGEVVRVEEPRRHGAERVVRARLAGAWRVPEEKTLKA